MEVRQLIKAKLKKKGMTIKVLSERTDIPYSTLKRYFSNDGDLASGRFLTILKLIDIDIKTIVRGSDDQNKFSTFPDYIKRSLERLF